MKVWRGSLRAGDRVTFEDYEGTVVENCGRNLMVKEGEQGPFAVFVDGEPATLRGHQPLVRRARNRLRLAVVRVRWAIVSILCDISIASRRRPLSQANMLAHYIQLAAWKFHDAEAKLRSMIKPW